MDLFDSMFGLPLTGHGARGRSRASTARMFAENDRQDPAVRLNAAPDLHLFDVESTPTRLDFKR